MSTVMKQAKRIAWDVVALFAANFAVWGFIAYLIYK
jgi:hypothetical protein